MSEWSLKQAIDNPTMESNTEVENTSEMSELESTEDGVRLSDVRPECLSSEPPVSPSPSPPPSQRQSPSIANVVPPSSFPSDLTAVWDTSVDATCFHQDTPSSSMVGNLNNLNIKSPLSLPDSPLSESSLTNELGSTTISAAVGADVPSTGSNNAFAALNSDFVKRTSAQNPDRISSETAGSMELHGGVGMVTSADLTAATIDPHSSEEELECINRENSLPEKWKKSQACGGDGGGGGSGGEEGSGVGEGIGGVQGDGETDGCVDESGSSSGHLAHQHHQPHHHHPHRPHVSPLLNPQPHHHHNHHSQHQHHLHSYHKHQQNHNNNNNSYGGNSRSCRRCAEDPASPVIGETALPSLSHNNSILISNNALCNNNNNNIMCNNNNTNNNNNSNINNANTNNVIGAGAVSAPNLNSITDPNAVGCQAFANNINVNSACCVPGNLADSAGSSDEEVKEFMLDPKPVLLGSGPPAGIHKVMRTTATNFLLPNEPSFSLCAISPRKRHRLNSASDSSLDLENMAVIQRPCLDFEKMQKTLMRKHNSHSVSRAKIVKIKTISGTGSKCLFDPAVCSFRSISTAYSPLPPVEEPSCAY